MTNEQPETTLPKLLPCPFCGNDEVESHVIEIHAAHACVYCPRCSAFVRGYASLPDCYVESPVVNMTLSDLALGEAIKAWNRREPPAREHKSIGTIYPEQLWVELTAESGATNIRRWQSTPFPGAWLYERDDLVLANHEAPGRIKPVNFANQLKWIKSELALCEKLAGKQEAKGDFSGSWRQQAKRWKWLLDYLQARESKP